MTNKFRFSSLIGLLLAITPLQAEQNAITDTEWYQMFDGLELRDNNTKLAGLKSFTAYTSKRYKYYNTSTSQLVIGDSVHEQNTLRYFLHIPYDYASNPDKQYPLFAFIHGSGGCLYLPSNNECYGSARARIIPTSSFLDSTNYSLKMLGGYLTDPDPTKDKPWYSCMDDNGLISAPVLTGVGDFAFVKRWFEWIKEHPEDDGFFILPLLNDETWWESMGYYTVDGQKVKQVEICNSYRVGYGEKVVNTGYGNTYKASELDLAIPLQLLIQLQDSLIANCRINADRQYVLGFSLGGIAVWDLLNHCPGRFAAAVASCSPSADPSPENCRRLIHENILAYLGDEGWVPKKMSQMAVDTINKLGGHAIARSTNSTWHGAGATIMRDEFESVLYNFLYGNERKHIQDSTIYQDCNLYTRSVTNGNFGTICLDKKMASFSGIETLYEVAGFAGEKGVALFPIEPNETIAGKSYIFKANANQIEIAMVGEAVSDTIPYNHFIGSFSGCNVPEGMYILINNLLYKTADGSNTIAANRAYFDVDNMEAYNPATAPARVVFLGGNQAPTDNPSLATQEAHHSINSSLKVLKDGQFRIVRDGKTYNAQGIEL